jgi:putative transposase
MATRKHPFVDGEFYHIYNRGNSKQKIFLDKSDYEHFIKCLFVCNTSKSFKFRDDIVDAHIDAFEFDRDEILVSIGAWVLMPNHFHIYITSTSHKSDLWEKSRISEFMRKLSTAYSKYFNAKYHRTGGLFEGSFKSVLILNDAQAKYLFSYIHLNPIKLIDSKWKEDGIKNKKEALEFLSGYKWSSYLDFQNKDRKESKILQVSDFPKYFNNVKEFDKEIFEWINYSPQVRLVGN